MYHKKALGDVRVPAGHGVNNSTPTLEATPSTPFMLPHAHMFWLIVRITINRQEGRRVESSITAKHPAGTPGESPTTHQ